MYGIDLDALHKDVKRKAREIDRGVNAIEIGMILISVALALKLAYEPVVLGIDYHHAFESALFVGVAVYLFLGRVRRMRRESGFEPSLRGDLDRALSQVDYHIWRSRTFQWWFLLPAALICIGSLIRNYDTKPLWAWPVIVGAMLVGLTLVRADLRCNHLPKKRNLEALRAKLTAEG